MAFFKKARPCVASRGFVTIGDMKRFDEKTQTENRFYEALVNL